MLNYDSLLGRLASCHDKDVVTDDKTEKQEY